MFEMLYEKRRKSMGHKSSKMSHGEVRRETDQAAGQASGESSRPRGQDFSTGREVRYSGRGRTDDYNQIFGYLQQQYNDKLRYVSGDVKEVYNDAFNDYSAKFQETLSSATKKGFIAFKTLFKRNKKKQAKKVIEDFETMVHELKYDMPNYKTIDERIARLSPLDRKLITKIWDMIKNYSREGAERQKRVFEETLEDCLEVSFNPESSNPESFEVKLSEAKLKALMTLMSESMKIEIKDTRSYDASSNALIEAINQLYPDDMPERDRPLAPQSLDILEQHLQPFPGLSSLNPE